MWAKWCSIVRIAVPRRTSSEPGRFLRRHFYTEREAANIFFEEAANIYFDEAMKTRPQEAWDALMKEILKGDSKRIWHGDLMENLTEEERRLILPMMKKYIEKYTPAGDFEKAKARVLVRGDLQKLIGETQGPVSRTESIFIIISIWMCSKLISRPRISTLP